MEIQFFLHLTLYKTRHIIIITICANNVTSVKCPSEINDRFIDYIIVEKNKSIAFCGHFRQSIS